MAKEMKTGGKKVLEEIGITSNVNTIQRCLRRSVEWQLGIAL